MEITNKTNNRNNKTAKVLVEDCDEDNDRNSISDKMSVYFRREINNGVSAMDTSSVNLIRTVDLSVFSAKIRDRKISVPEIQSQKEINKIEKQAVRKFYNNNYYSAIHNKTNYYLDENYFCIYANGFNDNIYIYVYCSEEF
jgi:hypothetical protein